MIDEAMEMFIDNFSKEIHLKKESGIPINLSNYFTNL